MPLPLVSTYLVCWRCLLTCVAGATVRQSTRSAAGTTPTTRRATRNAGVSSASATKSAAPRTAASTLSRMFTIRGMALLCGSATEKSSSSPAWVMVVLLLFRDVCTSRRRRQCLFSNSASYPQWDGEWVVYRLDRWVKLLAAVSPSSECVYEGKADVVYLQVTLCDPHLSA